MENVRLTKQIKTVFTEIIHKLVNPTFKFSEGGATQKTLANFIAKIEKEFGSVTAERLVDICVFAAYRFREARWTVKTVFGQATINNFKERKNGVKYYENKWLESQGLTRGYLVGLIADRREHPQAKYIYMASEENTKRRYLGQRIGYLLCQSSTLGWSPLSEACHRCSFTPECQSETNRKYPEIYRLRIENGNTSK